MKTTIRPILYEWTVRDSATGKQLDQGACETRAGDWGAEGRAQRAVERLEREEIERLKASVKCRECGGPTEFSSAVCENCKAREAAK